MECQGRAPNSFDTMIVKWICSGRSVAVSSCVFGRKDVGRANFEIESLCGIVIVRVVALSGLQYDDF